jgi:acyl carrier protein
MNQEDGQVILAQVRAIITDAIDVDPDAIQMNARLREDLRADSLATVEIVMTLEDVFGIEISEQQASELRTVADLVQAIAGLRQDASTSGA